MWKNLSKQDITAHISSCYGLWATTFIDQSKKLQFDYILTVYNERILRDLFRWINRGHGKLNYILYLCVSSVYCIFFVLLLHMMLFTFLYSRSFRLSNISYTTVCWLFVFVWNHQNPSTSSLHPYLSARNKDPAPQPTYNFPLSSHTLFYLPKSFLHQSYQNVFFSARHRMYRNWTQLNTIFQVLDNFYSGFPFVVI